MNCRELELVSGALLEGEAHPEAYAHVASCPRCRVLVSELGAIEHAARSLPSHEPGLELWSKIRAAAAREGLLPQPAAWDWFGLGVNWWLPRPAFAGALALILLMAVLVVSYSTQQLPVAEMAPTDPFAVAQGELVQEVSYISRYQVHLKHVEDHVLTETPPVDAELRELVARPLEVVDRAIEQTQLQLSSYPDDRLSREELHRLYQQKAAVLQAMTDASWYQDTR